MSTSLAAALAAKNLKASVILFPGQGSQHVGMAKNLSKRGRALFDMANEVLGYNLLKLCQEGPEEELDKTIHSQPAVFVTSLAAVENLAEMSPGVIENCIATAGFSVGEYASLVLAQSMEFVATLGLIKKRAEITQALSQTVPSGMMTVFYTNDSKVQQACHLAREFCVRSGVDESEAVCSVSNHLFPHGKVVGGHQVALEFIEKHAADFGLKRLKRLAVSGAFHTSLMAPAAKDLREILKTTQIEDPKINVYSNIDAETYQDAAAIRRALPRHVHLPVKWEQTIQKIYGENKIDGELPYTFECGPQSNMTTMLGMVNLKAKRQAYNIHS